MAGAGWLRGLARRCLSQFSAPAGVSLKSGSIILAPSHELHTPLSSLVVSRSSSVASPAGLRSLIDTRFLVPSSVQYPGAGIDNGKDFFSMLTSVRHFAKRAKKWQGSPYVWLPVVPGEQVPASRPNKGSVKNRNHQKRMAQRMAFAKLQAQTRREQQRAANIARDIARRKRWKEGAARAKAWAELQAERKSGKVAMKG